MSAASKAVFLSYASQDAEAARRICEALRAAGIEVWFDQNELVGGDAWDAKIRKQIKECALFVPLISAATQARLEGYFRIEWKLAAQRTHAMAEAKPFLLPIVIDDTRDTDAHVPVEFRTVQWTRIRGTGGNDAFCARVQALLEMRRETMEAEAPAGLVTTSPPRDKPRPAARSLSIAVVAAGLVVAVGTGVYSAWKTSVGETNSTVRPPPTLSAESISPRSSQPGPEKSVNISEAQKLGTQAKALLDEDPLAVRENYLAAERLCQRAIALDPSESGAWAVYARASSILFSDYQDQTSRRRESARSSAETAMRLAPESIEAGLAMSWYDYYVGGVSSRSVAIARLEALALRAPSDRRILELLARIQLRAARTKGVDSGFVWADRAEALAGGSPITLLERARFHADRNEQPQMADCIERSLKIRPTSLGYEWKLTLLVWWLGDLAGGRALLATLPASLREEDGIALRAFHIELWSRNFDEAVKVLTRIPRDFLEYESIYYSKGYLVGEALQHAGKLRAAEIQRRTALHVVEQRMIAEPSSGRLLYWKAKLPARLGPIDDARKCFDDAAELGVEFSRWSHTRSIEQPMLLGDHETALQAAEREVDAARFRWIHPFNELRFDPMFDPLRSSPRFQAVMAKGEDWLKEMQVRGGRNLPKRTVAPTKKVK